MNQYTAPSHTHTSRLVLFRIIASAAFLGLEFALLRPLFSEGVLDGDSTLRVIAASLIMLLAARAIHTPRPDNGIHYEGL